VQLSVTGEGLRIELMETEAGMFFVQGSPSPTEAGSHLLRALAAELGRMPNRVVVEGHTDARPFRNAERWYGNWELSVDRANAARRLLHEYGLRESQVVEVRGYADQKLLNAEDPNDARNRRVSVVVKL
jgi:chemotaxis protein MotB